jgi:acetone carboxylase gamma subunit
VKEVNCVSQCWENRCLQIRGQCCEVFTDPAYAWKDGTCQALRNTPEQMKQLRDTLKDYEVRMLRK